MSKKSNGNGKPPCCEWHRSLIYPKLGLIRCGGKLLICLHVPVDSAAYRPIADVVNHSRGYQFGERHPIDDGATRVDVGLGIRALMIPVHDRDQASKAWATFVELLRREHPAVDLSPVVPH